MLGLRGAVRAAWTQTRNGFASLHGSPRDLWIMFVLKVLESYNYFSLSRSFTLYLTEEFGVGDYDAGFWYGLWGTLLTAYGFALGGLIDYLGVRGSLVICFLLNVGSRIVMATTTNRLLLLVMLLGPNTVAGSLGVPVMTIGVKRYTHTGNRGVAFACFYSIMNVAALTQGVIMDALRLGLPRGFNIPSLPEGSLLNSPMRLFLASGCITSLAGLLLSFTLNEFSAPAPKRTQSEALDPSVHSQRSDTSAEVELPPSPEMPLLGAGSGSSSAKIEQGPRHRPHSGAGGAAAGGVGDAAAGAAGEARSGSQQGRPAVGRRQSMAELWEGVLFVLSSRGFWKFLAMCLFTVNLKSVFRHLDATLPKFQLRAFGCDTPIGLIYSINPAMIVLLVPIVGAMTTDFSHFDMIHLGGYVSALSPFWMVAFDTRWASAMFVAMLSLGEAIWSPRWYDYSMGVAPDGREGIFTALASAPLFTAMLPTGMISGALLQRYCPDNGQCSERTDPDSSSSGSARRRLLALLLGRGSGSANASNGSSSSGWLRSLAEAAAGGEGEGGGGVEPYVCNGRALWSIVGAITLSSPLLVLLTQRWIRPDPRDFSKLQVSRTGTLEGGATMDVNEADPLGVLENVYESQLLHQAESGGPMAGGDASGGPPAGSRPASAHAEGAVVVGGAGRRRHGTSEPTE